MTVNQSVKPFSTLIVAFLSVYLSLAVITHLVSYYDPIAASLSTYAVGQFGAIMETGFVLSMLSHFVMAYCLSQTLPPTLPARIGIGLLVLAGVGVLLVVLFPSSTFIDRPTDGIHLTGALLSFITFPIGSILLTVAFGQSDMWRDYQRTSAIIIGVALLVIIAFGVLYFTHSHWRWIGEKADVVVTTGWMIAAAAWLARIPSFSKN